MTGIPRLQAVLDNSRLNLPFEGVESMSVQFVRISTPHHVLSLRNLNPVIGMVSRLLARVLPLLLLLFSAFSATAQDDTEVLPSGKAVVYGQVQDPSGKGLSDVNIVVLEVSGPGTATDDEGRYRLEVDAGQRVTLSFTHISYEEEFKAIVLEEGKFYRFNPRLKDKRILDEVVIVDERVREEFIQTIPVETIEFIPDPSGDPIIAALKQLGATSNNELSSQYSVRGGNFDENLVYVNGFEIYRPLLVRSGQQEGFPFPNYNLTSRIAFSAGGFEAKYGDKLSSVLDITYKKPKEFDASVALSLLGGSAHIEMANDSATVGGIIGVRYRNNSYLLNSLETTGEYNPSFLDVQGLLSADLGKRTVFEIMGNYSANQFNFIPQDRSTSTGVVNDVVRLDVFFSGQEVSNFQTAMSGASITHKPHRDLSLKFLASAYRARENERFDVIGDYWLGAVESSLGEEDFGQVAFGLGVGTFHNFARNTIDSRVANIGHQGHAIIGYNFLEWGARYQREIINDQLNEWERLDSAGYSLPFTTSEVLLTDIIKSENDISSNRYTGYFQNNWRPMEDEDNTFSLTTGIRFHYWDLNGEFLASPRVQAAIRPNWMTRDSLKRDVVMKFATGFYAQPPFYRELRDLDGQVNTDVRSQKSIHAVAGLDYHFKAFDRDLRFATEVYYKYLWDIVPYEVENVRIRYYGQNAARGYTAGIDMRLYGELVEDAESWISLSILKTQEDLDEIALASIFGALNEDGTINDQGLLPRPTDQRLNFGMFFQDYIPGNKNFKVHLNFLLGTGLPFSPPENLALRNRFRVPPYRRVDIGFSALLLDSEKKKKDGFLKNVESIWASVEVFNLLGISNTVSYLWVRDTNNIVYAFPNFLTSRRLNARLIVKI